MRLFCLFLLLFALPVHAQNIRVFYASGTGFFVSNDGWLITNAHVVRHCQTSQVELHGAVEGSGQVIARDDTNDLALIRSQIAPDAVAPLSQDAHTITPGEEVMVMGYPLAAAENGQYHIARAKVIADTGPTGESQWLQFTSAAEQGNSGGPLLDTAGNVIGVVTGKTDVFEVNDRMRTRTYVSSSDIAVTLPLLKQFLKTNRVRYDEHPGKSRRNAGWVEHRARQFITNVRCVTGEEVS